MLKILLFLLSGLALPAFAQTKDTAPKRTSVEVIWLNSDFYNSISSEFEEFTIGLGYRYNYVGLGLTFQRYRGATNPVFLNAYGFLPIGNAFALYGTYGFEFEESKFGNAGAGIHVPLGKTAMIGVGGHTETGLQVFIGAQF